MNFVTADTISLTAFVILLFVVIGAFLAGVYWANVLTVGPVVAKDQARWVSRTYLVWLILFAALVQKGVLAEAPMPRLPIAFFVINLVSAAFAFSKVGTRMATTLPLYWLLAFQVFRLPLEIILHTWAGQGVIPVSMTWTGQNFDVITGVVAFLVVVFARENRKALWLGNIVGFILLLNVMRVAMMSSPLPFAWSVEPPLQLAFHLPYAWIVPVCVSGALFGHIVLTRALLRRRT